MITSNQPTIFGDKIVAALSSKSDGNLKYGLGDDAQTLKNRELFLGKIGIDIHHTSLVGITYDTDDFTKYRIATLTDKGSGMLAPDVEEHVDALVTTTPGHALFLPIADCAGVILYDPEKRVLMVSHLGRHSVEQEGAAKSIEYMVEQCGANAKDILAWVSPSVGKITYPLNAFEGRSLQEVILQQLGLAGVTKEHIEISAVDTAQDENYFSHSEYIKGNRDDSGRFAVVAMMREQGEPAVNMHI